MSGKRRRGLYLVTIYRFYGYLEVERYREPPHEAGLFKIIGHDRQGVRGCHNMSLI